MKTAEIIRFPLLSGANDVTRTHDLLITNQLLYRLSYISIFTFGVADLILTNEPIQIIVALNHFFHLELVTRTSLLIW